ncbi:MAG: hypothetical protein E3J54_01195 [Actinobacteria bacterium]|nr:MAG: hypothetical protein E3J54_01195 [Actinomycetota bacterium]
MKFYGYPNARIRAKKTRLFNKQFFEQLLKASKTKDVIATLTETEYRKDIEQGLLKHPGMLGMEEGLKIHFINTFKEVKRFLQGNNQAHNLIGLMIARFDLHNIKTILRGFFSNTSKQEIERDLIPAGELDESLLKGLLNQLSLKAVIDQLVVFKIPYSKPLNEGFVEYNKTKNLADLELRLDRFHYEHILGRAKGRSRNVKIVKELIQRDIDTTNIMTLLRLIREQSFIKEILGDKKTVEEEVKKLSKIRILFLKTLAIVKRVVIWFITIAKRIVIWFIKVAKLIVVWFKNILLFIFNRTKLQQMAAKAAKEAKAAEKKPPAKKTLDDFFIPGGKEIKLFQFYKLASLGDVEKIVEGVKHTIYYKPLKEGLKKTRITGSLAVLERKVEDSNISKTIRLFRDDPLGVGIVIAYLWAKFNEVINLRIILRGKEVEMPEKDIKEALVIV